jgi:hypothetical protein
VEGTAVADALQMEQVFFADPAVDRLVGLVFNLAAELQVTRERVRMLEHVLEERGVIPPGALEAVDAGAPIEAAIAADRRDFVEHFLAPLSGRAASRNDLTPDEVGARP